MNLRHHIELVTCIKKFLGKRLVEHTYMRPNQPWVGCKNLITEDLFAFVFCIEAAIQS